MKKIIKTYFEFIGCEFSKKEIVIYSIATILITIVCLCGETIL